MLPAGLQYPLRAEADMEGRRDAVAVIWREHTFPRLLTRKCGDRRAVWAARARRDNLNAARGRCLGNAWRFVGTSADLPAEFV